MVKDAKFSECGKYRFWLSRVWNESKESLMLIGLNPSTANADTDDPTIRRIVSLASANGFGGIYMTNLFPFITAYPEQLKIDRIGDNDQHMVFVSSSKCEKVCFCWGNFFVYDRDKQMKANFPDALCFGKNKNGSPKHPLYLKSNTQLVKF